MADRYDVDDPLTGYMAFTKAEGWLQGFVTCTTFTTWNHGFRWDSTNPEVDLLDTHCEDEEKAKSRPPPLIDEHGTLSAAYARSIDQEKLLIPETAETVDRIPGRSRNRINDHPLFSEQGIHE